MNLEDVEKWSATDEGRTWLEAKKMPLVEKRNELLKEVTELKERLADASERSNATDAKLKGYLENLKARYCLSLMDDVDNYKTKVLDDKDIREFVKNKIEKQAELVGGFIADIDNEGNFTLATSEGKTFAEYYKEWTETDGAKAFLQCLNSGGGALGSGFGRGLESYSTDTIKKMSPAEIAEKLDNPQFRNTLQNLNN